MTNDKMKSKLLKAQKAVITVKKELAAQIATGQIDIKKGYELRSICSDIIIKLEELDPWHYRHMHTRKP